MRGEPDRCRVAAGANSYPESYPNGLRSLHTYNTVEAEFRSIIHRRYISWIAEARNFFLASCLDLEAKSISAAAAAAAIA